MYFSVFFRLFSSVVFWFGDLNFRIEDYDIHVVKCAIDSNKLPLLWERDQVRFPLAIISAMSTSVHDQQRLLQHKVTSHDLFRAPQLNMAKNTESILEGFNEGALNFPPTYKFDVGTHTYDTRFVLRPPQTPACTFYSHTSNTFCVLFQQC